MVSECVCYWSSGVVYGYVPTCVLLKQLLVALANAASGGWVYIEGPLDQAGTLEQESSAWVLFVMRKGKCTQPQKLING